jgi:hypothetical protein
MKMKINKIFILVIILGLLVNIPSIFAQESDSQPEYGLTASFQDSQFDIIVPFWTSNTFKISPALGFVSVSDVGQDYNIGIILNKYLSRKKVSTYVGFRSGVLISSPKNGDSVTDAIFGFSFGGEYFIDNNFSFGIESQLNISLSNKKSNRFGNPDGTNINTGMAVFGSIYFN